MKKYIFILFIAFLLLLQAVYSKNKVSEIYDWDELIKHYQSYCAFDGVWFSCVTKNRIVNLIADIPPDKLIKIINESNLDSFELLYILKEEGADWRIMEIIKRKGYRFPEKLFGCSINDSVKFIGDDDLINIFSDLSLENASANCDFDKMKNFFEWEIQ